MSETYFQMYLAGAITSSRRTDETTKTMEYKGFTIQETTDGWMMLGKYEFFKQGSTCHFAASIQDAQDQINELTANDND